MDKIKLLRGDDLVIKNSFTVKQLTVNQIIDFTEENGEENYFSLINLFLLRPFDIMDKLDDEGIDYETLTNYDLFIILYKTGKYNEHLKILIGQYNFKIYQDSDNNEVVLYDKDTDTYIDKVIYNSIREYLCLIHHIKLNPVLKAGHDEIKKFRINKKRKEHKKNEDSKFQSQLFDLVSSIIVGSNGSVTFFNIWNMPIYSAYTTLIKVLKLQNYSNTMFGIYTGNISSNDVSMNTLDWTTNI